MKCMNTGTEDNSSTSLKQTFLYKTLLYIDIVLTFTLPGLQNTPLDTYIIINVQYILSVSGQQLS